MERIARGGFRMTETEVTRGEFAAFVEATGYRTDAETKTGGKQGCFTYQGGVDFGWNEEASWRAPAPTSAA